MKSHLAVMSMAFLAFVSQQKFRVEVEGVRVDVLVTKDGRPLGGLAKDQFELRDNEVRQKIDTISAGDLPLSVMLVLDTSASLRGQPLQDLKEAAFGLIALLTPNDRAAVLTFSGSVSLLAPWTSDPKQLHKAIFSAQSSGATALHDAAYAALTLRDDQAGKPLVLIFSDGDDTGGWLSGSLVIDAARRNDAVVYAVGLRPVRTNINGFRVDFRSGLQLPVSNLTEAALAEPFLAALAKETGGRYIDALRSDRLSSTFAEIFTEFRNRYVITYTPTGVSTTGWHKIDVKLTKAGGSVIARRGYSR